MTEEQKAAVVNARCTTAMIRAIGMQAENMQRQHLGESMAYVHEDFLAVIIEEGVHHNSIHRILFE